jgi:epoxyqueuosine reductase
MKILLHTCCAPCASHCAWELLDTGHDVTLFFSNANIATQEEWQRRLDAVQILAHEYAIPLVVDEPSHAEWLVQVASGFEQEPERGTRCERCFRFSLTRTYETALAQRYEAFTTSLTISPHKSAALIFNVGKGLSETMFLPLDFKKQNGFKRSLELSEKLGLYRQSYCGCEFSLR